MNYRQAELSDAGKITRLNIDIWKSTYKGIISDQILNTLSYEKSIILWKERMQPSNENEFFHVAENEDNSLAGFSVGSFTQQYSDLKDPPLSNFIGELCAIYVLESVQRNGIGTKLFKKVVSHLLNYEINSMIVWVFNKTPYRKFYEHLGGIYITKKPIKIMSEIYTEIAYGWEDINKIF